jgi:hypothetical protein
MLRVVALVGLAWLSPTHAVSEIGTATVPSGMWLELTWRDLRHNEVIWSSGEVNRLIDELGSQGLPSIDFAHIKAPTTLWPQGVGGGGSPLPGVPPDSRGGRLTEFSSGC